MERAIGVALLWVIAFAPGLFFIALFRALQPVLKGRRNEIIIIMSRGETAQKYLRTFGASTSPGFEPTLDELFFSSFGRSKYYFPLTVLVTVAVLSMVTVFTRVGFDMGVPDFISAKIRMLGIEVIAGLGGAFVWGVYDGLRRFETIDLSPTDLHYIALRMIVSPLLAPIITIAFTDTLRPLVAFGIGAFPLNTLANFIKGQAR